MSCPNDLAQASSQEEITLGEILSSLVGKYVVIVVEIEQERQTITGVLNVTKHKLVMIGKESYKLDTPVAEVLQIEDVESKTPLCKICPLGCEDNPEHCINVIGEIVVRRRTQ